MSKSIDPDVMSQVLEKAVSDAPEGSKERSVFAWFSDLLKGRKTEATDPTPTDGGAAGAAANLTGDDDDGDLGGYADDDGDECCPKCGAHVASSHDYCPKCGVSLYEEAPTDPPTPPAPPAETPVNKSLGADGEVVLDADLGDFAALIRTTVEDVVSDAVTPLHKSIEALQAQVQAGASDDKLQALEKSLRDDLADLGAAPRRSGTPAAPYEVLNKSQALGDETLTQFELEGLLAKGLSAGALSPAEAATMRDRFGTPKFAVHLPTVADLRKSLA